jgi:hypothetical protein
MYMKLFWGAGMTNKNIRSIHFLVVGALFLSSLAPLQARPPRSRTARGAGNAIVAGVSYSANWVSRQLDAGTKRFPRWAKRRIVNTLSRFATPTDQERAAIEKWVNGDQLSTVEVQTWKKFRSKALSTRTAIAVIVIIILTILAAITYAVTRDKDGGAPIQIGAPTDPRSGLGLSGASIPADRPQVDVGEKVFFEEREWDITVINKDGSLNLIDRKTGAVRRNIDSRDVVPLGTLGVAPLPPVGAGAALDPATIARDEEAERQAAMRREQEQLQIAEQRRRAIQQATGELGTEAAVSGAVEVEDLRQRAEGVLTPIGIRPVPVAEAAAEYGTPSATGTFEGQGRGPLSEARLDVFQSEKERRRNLLITRIEELERKLKSPRKYYRKRISSQPGIVHRGQSFDKAGRRSDSEELGRLRIYLRDAEQGVEEEQVAQSVVAPLSSLHRSALGESWEVIPGTISEKWKRVNSEIGKYINTVRQKIVQGEVVIFDKNDLLDLIGEIKSAKLSEDDKRKIESDLKRLLGSGIQQGALQELGVFVGNQLQAPYSYDQVARSFEENFKRIPESLRESLTPQTVYQFLGIKDEDLEGARTKKAIEFSNIIAEKLRDLSDEEAAWVGRQLGFIFRDDTLKALYDAYLRGPEAVEALSVAGIEPEKVMQQLDDIQNQEGLMMLLRDLDAMLKGRSGIIR